MLRWLILLTLFVQNSLVVGLYDERDDYHRWRRGAPSTAIAAPDDEDCIKDILVIWDNSQSVGTRNFLEKVRPFLKNLVNNSKLNVGKDGTHIGFITFASNETTRELLKIGSIMSQDNLTKWLNGLDYENDLMGEWTYTGKAFKLANDAFSSKSPLNHRDNVDDVILLFTDGEPRAKKNYIIKEQKEMATNYSTILMDDKKVTIISLAVGPQAKKEKFKKNIRAWSNHMITSAFDDLGVVLKNISDGLCPPPDPGNRCSCDGDVMSTEQQYINAGENKLLLFKWPEPKLKCDKPVKPDKTVNPLGTLSPKKYGLGTHKITYTFSYEDGNKRESRNCVVSLKVDACECPRTQRVDKMVETAKAEASVSWSKPTPTCPTTPSADNPQSTSGSFGVGEHTVKYKFTYSNDLHSFDIECRVDIIVAVRTGKLCNKKYYNPVTHVCCCGNVHKKKSGYQCCGMEHYNSLKEKCCNSQSAIIVSLGGNCP